MKMLPFFFHLPSDLFEMVIRHLSKSDLFRVSVTCERCRETLAPRIFHTIIFGNDEKTSNSALEAVKSHGNLVRRLIFECSLEPHGLSGELPLLESPALPSAARELLGGSATPNCDALDVKFIYWDMDDCPTVSRFASFSGHVEAPEAEQRFRWGAALNETYTAIAQNMGVRDLKIHDMPPVRVSALSARLVGKMLGRLKSATLGLYNPICPVCNFFWHPALVVDAREDLLCHMKELSCLNLVGSWHNYNVFPQIRINLPMLQKLSLHHTLFLSDGLVRFLEAHAATLSEVTLTNCTVGFRREHDRPEPEETWAALFRKTTALQLPALVEFDIYNEEGNARRERFPLSDVQEKPAKDLKRLVFAYASLPSEPEDHHVASDGDDVGLMAAKGGPDYREYHRLMRYVESNAQRIASAGKRDD